MIRHTSSSSIDGSAKRSSNSAHVNCLVIEHIRNGVAGVNGLRVSTSAQPQACRAMSCPRCSTATAPPGPA